MEEESPMHRIESNWNTSYFNYREIMDVLKGFMDPRDKNNKRYEGLKENLSFFSEEEQEAFLDEPYNTLRIMALVVDSYSILAHIRQDEGDKGKARFLRTAKDYLMTQLALNCLESKKRGANIKIEYRHNDGESPSMEIDIRHLGHVGWHFR